MKKLLISTAAVALFAAPAFAASMTVSFASDDGTTTVMTFDDEGTAAMADGSTLAYTYDEEALKLCAEIPETGEVCATFAEAGTGAVGESIAYTLSIGGGGTATITAVEE